MCGSLIEEASGRWKIELVNFQKFEEVLERDVLNAFCRCFVHSERLTSTISCMYSSEQLHGRGSIAFGRDLLAMVWFTIGTLRELALALQALRSALDAVAEQRVDDLVTETALEGGDEAAAAVLAR